MRRPYEALTVPDNHKGVTKMKNTNRWKTAWVVLAVLCAATAIGSHAQTLTTLHSFDGTDGSYPQAGLVQATDGNFYGTTRFGGAYARYFRDNGTIFKITPSGTLTRIYSFCSQRICTDGAGPLAGLVLGTDGNLYGTTSEGGTTCVVGCGTVFRITLGGTLTTLHSFDLTDGAFPFAGLIQASDGNFYGTTDEGGPYGNACGAGCGTIFKITCDGALNTLYSFCSQPNCADGSTPYAGLIQAADGNFYGTTGSGGTKPACLGFGGCGTVFKITPSGTLTTLQSFYNTSARTPVAGLIQADGNLYGTTESGGATNYGTVFQITPPDHSANALHSFDITDGYSPEAGLIQATDGNLYGSTPGGGANGGGTIFEITPSGTLTTLYSFCSQSGCPDGNLPIAGLVQGTDGNFYGTTAMGGTIGSACGSVEGCGTVFRLSLGLGPFVKTLPNFGNVGSKVIILGNNLSSTSSVTFNGTSATFQIESDTSIIAKVPSGATTGNVEVVTQSGTLTSNVTFRVLP
jgi:uncharacterized repeat protein (TIGR03803 family)